MTAHPARLALRAAPRAGIAALTAGVALLVIAATVLRPGSSAVVAVALGGGIVLACWLFATQRYTWSLAVVMVYLGVADGYLKLKLDTQWATLMRDVLLYAVVAGALVRLAISERRVELPPWTGWVVAFVALVLVQMVHPRNEELGSSIGGIRPHVEFVPLFFFGYLLMREPRRLKAFLGLLVALAAINGAVSYWQYSISPAQFAAWGPGYAERINGTGDFQGGGRTFADSGDTNRTRPFGLGSDTGFQGILAITALPGGLALLTLARRPSRKLLWAALTTGAVIGTVTSQARVAVVGAMMAVLAFVVLGASVRRKVSLLATLLVVGGVCAFVISSFSAGDANAFDRYRSLAPDKIVSTSLEERGNTLVVLPAYFEYFATGGGLGRSGPAAILAGEGIQIFNSESEFTYLLVETGIAGLLVLLIFALKGIATSFVRLRRVADQETRLLLAAVAAPLVAFFALWPVAPMTSGTPGSPYLWFATGVIVWWLVRRGSDDAPATA